MSQPLTHTTVKKDLHKINDFLHNVLTQTLILLVHAVCYQSKHVHSHFLFCSQQDGSRHAAVGALRAPMETIFVRGITEGSAAERAGLQRGDRLVAVNSKPLSGLSYQQVVQLIQQSPPYLHLLVVPQQDDVLQKVR